MNDHNLDDLIIDTPDHKGSKAKGLLTIIALFIVVLIVAIILTKIILKDPDQQSSVIEDNETEMISPELTLQEAVDDEEQDDKALSDMIKSEMDAPKEPENVEEVAEETVVIEEEKPVNTPSKETTPATESKTESKTETADKPVKKEIVKIPETPVKKSTPVTKAQPKPKLKSKPKQEPVKARNERYYIQVGSFSKMPSASRLISTLKKQRFRYRIMKINNMHKVMVGPYKSRAEADRAIVRVKDLINKSAFVVKK